MSATGMVTVRAIDGQRERDAVARARWSSTKLNVRSEDVVVGAVGRGPAQPDRQLRVRRQGRQGRAFSRSSVARTLGGLSVIEKGLTGGETVVTDGQMLLSNGTAVDIRERKAGA